MFANSYVWTTSVKMNGLRITQEWELPGLCTSTHLFHAFNYCCTVLKLKAKINTFIAQIVSLDTEAFGGIQTRRTK